MKEAAPGAVPPAQRGPLDILPCNHETVRCFLALSTQWHYVGDAGMPKGLDYGAVQAVIALRGVKKKRRAAVFEGIREMEAVALPILQDKVRDAQRRAAQQRR